MFTLAGYSTRKSQLLAGINNIGACLCSLIGMVLIDRVGRLRLLWAGAVGLGLCMFLETGMMTMLKKQVVDRPRRRLGVPPPPSSSFSSLASSPPPGSTSPSPTQPRHFHSKYAHEAMPLVPSAGVSDAAPSPCWSRSGSSPSSSPAAISQYTFLIHGCVNLIPIPVVWVLYPEAKRRTLEEMDLFFASDKPWVWEAEKEFARLKLENAQMLHSASDAPEVFITEEKAGGGVKQLEGSSVHSSN